MLKQKTWDELNSVQLVNKIASWSEMCDFSSWNPDEEEREIYRLMYEKAKKNDPTNYKLAGCIRPGKFG